MFCSEKEKNNNMDPHVALKHIGWVLSWNVVCNIGSTVDLFPGMFICLKEMVFWCILKYHPIPLKGYLGQIKSFKYKQYNRVAQ